MAFDDPLWMQSDGSAPVYSAREDRILLSILFNEGVIRGMRAKQRAAGAQMRVQLEDGDFAIQGDDSASPPQGMYLGRWTDDALDANMWAIAAAPGSGTRLDLLYVRVNDPNHGGPAGRNFTLGVASATSPTQPTLPTSAIPIALVTVPAGKVSILNSDITDRRGVGGLKSEIPIGTVLDYSGPEASITSFYPNYVPADGRAINRLTYFGYTAQVGTVHGAGDGSSTVNVPDYRGRVGVGLDNMGGADAGRLAAANTLGASGGAETFTIMEANLPPHAHSMQNHTHTLVHTHDMSHDHPSAQLQAVGVFYGVGANVSPGAGSGRAIDSGGSALVVDVAAFGGSTGGASNATTSGPSSASTGNGAGTSTAISNMQPYILVNKIVKVA